MALHLPKLLDTSPESSAATWEVCQLLLRARKVTFVLTQILSPDSELMGCSSWAFWFLFLLFFLTGIWPTFSLWAFLPSLFYETPVKTAQLAAQTLVIIQADALPFQSVELFMLLAYRMQFILCSLSVSGWQKHTLSSLVFLSDSLPAGTARIRQSEGSGLIAQVLSLLLLTSSLFQLFQALIPMAVRCCSSATLLFTLPFFLLHRDTCLQGTGKPQPALGVNSVPETGWAEKWNQSQQGAPPPQGDLSISTLLIIFKPTLQEVSVGKNLAMPV